MPGAVPIACRAGQQGDRLTKLLFELTIWRGLLALGEPFRKLVSFYLFFSRSLWTAGADVLRIVWRVVGWLSAPPRGAFWRQLGQGLVELKRWHLTLAAVVAFTAFSRALRQWKESSDDQLKRKRQLEGQLENAHTYEGWALAATKLEQLEGRNPSVSLDRWKRETRLYDRKLLEERLQHLRVVRQQGDVHEMHVAVRADLLRNLGNMTNSELQDYFPLVPEPIREYIDEVKLHLQLITEYDGPQLGVKEKLAFLQETRHAFGRTALVLSGGGALGAFHLGVVKALFQHGLLPRVLAGSSVGSIVAAIIATNTDEQLDMMFNHMSEFDLSFFSNSTASQFFRHFLLKGTLQDIEVLQNRLRRLLGDDTFLTAYLRTGRVLNVAVTAADTNEPSRVLNYLTAPDVVVWSAVSCSSAFPLLFKPSKLLARNREGKLVEFAAESLSTTSVRTTERRWRDGSLEEDLPMRGLSETFNVNYFLVSQTNPHIVPALNLKKQVNRKLGNFLEAEWKHRCRQIQDICPDWLPGKWLKVFSQNWEGDVTMVLPSSYLQIKKAITNPSKEDLLQASRQGETATWAKLSAIHTNCGIEMMLDSCLTKLIQGMMAPKTGENMLSGKELLPANGLPTVPMSANSLADVGGGKNGLKRGQHGMGSRIPSWINMNALNMPEQMMPAQHQHQAEPEHRGEGPDLRTLHREGPPGEEGITAVIPTTSDSLPSVPEHHKNSKVPFGASSDLYGDTDDTSNTDSTSDGTSASTSSEYEAGFARSRFEPHGPSPNQLRQRPGSLEGLPENEAVLAGIPNDEDIDGFVGGSTSALDCTDRSVDTLWETLRTLNASSKKGLDLLGVGYAAEEEGLDFIAP
ncbi:hypothetical protein WJX84_008684 [Apatococcus fuscideae]|uniref:PNPLA domain-containing protein n=1 Tax=Apatococcus fuscideae TaxID=2026836 RepID=A0AAW1SCF8_9CHLO